MTRPRDMQYRKVARSTVEVLGHDLTYRLNNATDVERFVANVLKHDVVRRFMNGLSCILGVLGGDEVLHQFEVIHRRRWNHQFHPADGDVDALWLGGLLLRLVILGFHVCALPRLRSASVKEPAGTARRRAKTIPAGVLEDQEVLIPSSEYS